MASAGFEVFNTGGNLVIDSNFANLCLQTKGTVASSNFTTYGNQTKSLFTVTYTSPSGGEPLLAWAGVGYPVAIFSITTSGSTWTWQLVSNAPAGTSLTYYIFDKPQSGQITAGAGGLEVYNSSGQIMYNSNLKYMRVLDFGSAFGNATSSSPPSYTYAGVSTVALVEASLGVNIQNVASSPGINGGASGSSSYRLSGAYTSGDVVTTGAVNFNSQTNLSGHTASPTFSTATVFMVLDVSNY